MVSTSDLGKLVSGDKPAAYSGDTYLSAFRAHEAIQGLDASRAGERKSLLEIMAGVEDNVKHDLGPAYKQDSPEAIQGFQMFQGMYVAIGKENLGKYLDAHFERIAGELSPEEQLNLAFSYSPEKAGKGPYEDARKLVTKAKTELKGIGAASQSLKEKGKDETGYLPKSIEHIKDESLRNYILRPNISREWLAWKQMTAQTVGVKTIQEFGAAKYLAGSREVIMPQVAAFSEALSKADDRGKAQEKALKDNPDIGLRGISDEVRDSALQALEEKKKKSGKPQESKAA